MTHGTVPALLTAINDEAVVTIVDDEGTARTGTVKRHPTLARGYFILRPVGAGPVWIFSTYDAAEVIFE